MCVAATPPPRSVSSEMCRPVSLTTVATAVGGPSSPKAAPALKFNNFADKEQNDFERQVYEGELRWAMKKKKYFPGLSPAELEVVEGKYQLRKDAAIKCRELLSRARADLLKAKEEGKPEAIKVTRIGIASAYRDPSHDFEAWQRAFRKHYKATSSIREKKEGGEHGPRAIEYMVEVMIPIKAVAGFSNHTSGIAVDFSTALASPGSKEEELGPNTNQHQAWQNSWLYDWLTKNAVQFGFKQLRTEEWHWDYKAAH